MTTSLVLYRLFSNIDRLIDNELTRTEFINEVKKLYIPNSIVNTRIPDDLIVLSSLMIYFANNERHISNINKAIAFASRIMNSQIDDKYAALFILSFIPASNKNIRRITRTVKHNVLIPFIKTK